MKKRNKQTIFRESMSKLMLDIGKLVFGGVCIAGLLRGELPHAILFTGGFFVAILIFAIGIILAIKEEPSDENKE